MKDDDWAAGPTWYDTWFAPRKSGFNSPAVHSTGFFILHPSSFILVFILPPSSLSSQGIGERHSTGLGSRTTWVRIPLP